MPEPAQINKGNKIHKLTPVLIDKIAAGEVIDAPYSVIKELVENSLDAGAKEIRIFTKGAGLDSIIIEDNGFGISFNDLPLSIDRHATSKISRLEDIHEIDSFGFRGEALASISSISRMIIQSKTSEETGGIIEVRGGEIIRHEKSPAAQGTVIRIEEMFYSTPARKKFIKSERRENQKIHQALLKLTLPNPTVRFIYYRDEKEFFHYEPVKSIPERIGQIYGKKIQDNLLDFHDRLEDVFLSGYIGSERVYRSNRDAQHLFINGRSVELKSASFLVKKSYGELLPHGAHPYYFLFFDVNPKRLDVNVHPAKKEVRLLDESAINGMIVRNVTQSLRPDEPVSFLHQTKQSASGFSENNSASKHSENEFLIQNRENYYPVRRQYETNISNQDDPITLLHNTENTSDSIEDLQSENSTRKDRFESSFSNKRNSFIPRRHFGVIFGTYILAESDDAFYLIDQHTAHERVNFEKMKRKLKLLAGERQPLMQPLILELDPDDLDSLLEKKELLLEAGFDIDAAGPGSLAVREIPAFLEKGTEGRLLLKMLDELSSGESVLKAFEDMAAMKACKASIKKNDVVSPVVLNGILEELSRCEEPSRCPHGRPTMIRLTQQELDRMFLRI